MNKKETIIKFLRENGFRPKENVNLENYLFQLRNRLRRNDKDLYIIEDEKKIIDIYIGKKEVKEFYNKSFNVKFSADQDIKFKQMAKDKGMDLSKLIRNLLEEEYKKYNI